MKPKNLSPPWHLLSNHRPLSSHAAAAGQLDSSTWHQQQLIQLAALLTPLLTPPTHSALGHSWNKQFPPPEYLKELRILLFQRALYNYQAVMYLKKEIIISFFKYITAW